MSSRATPAEYVEELFLDHGAERVGRGLVFDVGHGYWASPSVWDQPVEALPEELETKVDRLDEVEVLKQFCRQYEGMFTLSASGGSPDRWVAFARRLARDVPELDLDVSRHPGVDVTIPVSVAREGQTAMFAYLAAHGWGNQDIAAAFEVAPSTVRVNLSKYKNS